MYSQVTIEDHTPWQVMQSLKIPLENPKRKLRRQF